MSNHDHDHPILLRLPYIFKDLSLYRQLLRCRGPDAQHLLNSFQSILDLPYLEHDLRRNLIVAIQRLSFKAGLYPKCYELKYQIQTGEEPVTAGGFADIYRGIFGDDDDSDQRVVVCMKVMRVYETSDKEHIMKQFAREVLLWGQLSHPNVLPIYGLYRLRGRPCLVMPWMENGDVNKYLKEHPSASRLNLAIDVASGLQYLHAYGIIHGDLKGANILISTSGRAHVADFGLSSISSDPQILAWTSHSSISSKGGSVRWQAPELFDMENDQLVHNTESSDVYALGCVCYEIFTGQIPLSHITRDPAVMYQVKSGLRPSKPPPSSPPWNQWGLTPSIWSIMNSCWVENPLRRPAVKDILRGLGGGDLERVERDYGYGYRTRSRFRKDVDIKCGRRDLEEDDSPSSESSIRILDELFSKVGEEKEEGDDEEEGNSEMTREATTTLNSTTTPLLEQEPPNFPPLPPFAQLERIFSLNPNNIPPQPPGPRAVATIRSQDPPPAPTSKVEPPKPPMSSWFGQKASKLFPKPLFQPQIDNNNNNSNNLSESFLEPTSELPPNSKPLSSKPSAKTSAKTEKLREQRERRKAEEMRQREMARAVMQKRAEILVGGFSGSTGMTPRAI